MKSTRNISVNKLSITNGSAIKDDKIVEESPLQIVVAYHAEGKRKKEVLSVTMRTPGDDFNMVRGFLFCEGIIQKATDIASMKYIGNPENEAMQRNMILVGLTSNVCFNMNEKKRNFLSGSACGFCGRATDDTGINIFNPLVSAIKIKDTILYKLPAILLASQGLFSETGGAHAVALMNENGVLQHISEDVGRHNAMDKLVGQMLRQNKLPLKDKIVLFSGRLSYELVQKSLMAGIPVVCAIGAPTSLAVELAEDYGMTLVGFLKNEGFNIYSAPQRILYA